MNKTELVKYVSRKTKLPYKASWQAVDTMLDGIKKYTKSKEGVRLSGFGNFKYISAKPQRKWNTSTKKYTWTKGHREINFSPGKSYRDYLYK